MQMKVTAVNGDSAVMDYSQDLYETLLKHPDISSVTFGGADKYVGDDDFDGMPRHEWVMKLIVIDALLKNKWVQSDAASYLGMTGRSLNYTIKKYNITNEHWRKNKT